MNNQSTKIIVNDEPVTPMTMLQSAREQNASIEQMQQLMEMQFKWEENDARKEYFQAVAKFKALPLKITKDKTNSQFNSSYTGIGNLVNTVNPKLSKVGLSASWTIKQTDKVITVTCKLSHSKGHSEEVSFSAFPDTSGGSSKNPIQQAKSTITYLKIATYEAIAGVASSDDPGDDDGNNSSNIKYIDEKQLADLTALLSETNADKPLFLKFLKINSLDVLPVIKYKMAISALEKKRT